LSWKHATITPAECIKCKLCEDSCPYGAILPPTEGLSKGVRLRGKTALVILLAASPIIIALGGLGGYLSSSALSRSHPTISLAERIRYEQQNLVDPKTDMVPVESMTDASEAFRETDKKTDVLYTEALAIKARFDFGTVAAGLFMGLVISLKLIQLSLRRKRTDYTPNKATCLSCGRCFKYCPVGQQTIAEMHEGEGE
ncbi:MAG TPA: hypothetical protein ENL03_02230, partial [Phycisphaerae bacterium]|nr:hypothetical protein [Phycisphaerae bacterium]